MLPGTMQQTPLMISAILAYAARAHPRREIVSRLVEEPLQRYDYARLAERAARLANLLRDWGLAPGDRISSLAWNTHRHVELFFGVTGYGAVLHTANPRFSEDQIAYTLNHAESGTLFYERNFAPLVERLASRLPNVRRYVMLSDEERLIPGVVGAASYETSIAGQDAAFAWPQFDENAAAFLCYTSGTTGDPKGVAYSHRSVVLHALGSGLSAALGFTAFDCIMPCQSLYHATAWGLPFAAAINGCKLVLPCDRFDGASLQSLIDREGVTFSGGVPTIWTGYLDHLRRTGADAGPLRRLVIGGSAVPRSLADTFERDYGISVRQIWGMTETSPLGVIGTPTPEVAALGAEEADEIIRTRQGRLQFGVELRIVDGNGRDLANDGVAAGALHVRGPWVIERYYRSERSALDADGWFDTGDIATIDQHGFLRITDRTKDVIKSGGEWISSIDIENVAVAVAGVRIAAVIGAAHPRWEERPVLIVQRDEGACIGEADVLAILRGAMPKWWLPDRIVFAEVPLTSTGKIDKKLLRERYRGCLLAEG